ncbi:MAG: hypothetical protein V2I37_00085 [Marinilabiliaceae bacterium]|nr:hypothetical protein [Marinilabiliaceae bacterium]
MIKRLFGFIIMAAVVVSCGSNTEKKTDAAAEEAAQQIEFASLIDDPAAYLEKEITLEGNVVHVCKHSGKKMFIVGENPDIRLYISAGEEVPKFPMELLGSNVTVTGLLSKVEAGEKMGEGAGEGEHKEGEMAGNTAMAGSADEDCETEAAVAAQPVLADYVLHYVSHKEK